MTEICYLNLKQAREVLADIGVELTPRQIKRAADKDAHGMTLLHGSASGRNDPMPPWCHAMRT